jgi:hypothetical protein
MLGSRQDWESAIPPIIPKPELPVKVHGCATRAQSSATGAGGATGPAAAEFLRRAPRRPPRGCVPSRHGAFRLRRCPSSVPGSAAPGGHPGLGARFWLISSGCPDLNRGSLVPQAMRAPRLSTTRRDERQQPCGFDDHPGASSSHGCVTWFRGRLGQDRVTHLTQMSQASPHLTFLRWSCAHGLPPLTCASFQARGARRGVYRRVCLAPRVFFADAWPALTRSSMRPMTPPRRGLRGFWDRVTDPDGDFWHGAAGTCCQIPRSTFGAVSICTTLAPSPRLWRHDRKGTARGGPERTAGSGR